VSRDLPARYRVHAYVAAGLGVMDRGMPVVQYRLGIDFATQSPYAFLA
jgi:hypothetical protein